MASSTPTRTNNPNTCHNTSVPEDPSPPLPPPSSVLLRTRSERLIGASARVQQEGSHHSPFITPSSLPTRPTHTTLTFLDSRELQVNYPKKTARITIVPV